MMTRRAFSSGRWRSLAESIHFSDRRNIEEWIGIAVTCWTGPNPSSATNQYWPESKVSYSVSFLAVELFLSLVFVEWNSHLRNRCISLLIDRTSRVVRNVRQFSSNFLSSFFVGPPHICRRAPPINRLDMIRCFLSHFSSWYRSISLECTEWFIPIGRKDRIFPFAHT